MTASEETGIFWRTLFHKFVYVPQLLIAEALVCFICCLYTLTLSFNLVFPSPVSPIYSSKQPEEITTYMILKLMQSIGVFNVNVLFTFFNVCSLDSNNDLEHSHRVSWYFLTHISSMLNSSLVSSFLRLGGCLLLLIILMFSNPGTFYLFVFLFVS